MYKCNHCNITFKNKDDEGILTFRGKMYCKRCEEPIVEISVTSQIGAAIHGSQATLISNSDNRITTNNYYGGGLPDEQIETPYGPCRKSEARLCKKCRRWVPLTYLNSEQEMCDNCIGQEGFQAYEEGKTFFEMELFDEALIDFQKFEPVCNNPKELAILQYYIARCFYEQKQWKDAFKYFVKSREQVPDSLYYMGLCFFYGQGISSDKIKALQIIKKATLQDNAAAMDFYNKIELYRVKRNGKWGFIDKTGEIIISCEWRNVNDFSEGYALVQYENGKWGFIDKTGDIVIPCKWEEAGNYSEGLASVKDENGKWGGIDKAGNLIFSCKWDCILHGFSNGLADVKDDNGKWGFIDKRGTIVIPCKWRKVKRFCEELAGVQDDNKKWGFIDKRGTLIIPCKWDSIGDFTCEGLALVKDKSGKCGYINKIGTVTIPCKWLSAGNFSEGMAYVVNIESNNFIHNRTCGFVNKAGILVIPYKWQDVGDFSEGLAKVQDEHNRWGYIDRTGKLAIPYRWYGYSFHICNFRNGLAKVVENGTNYYINKEGSIITETEY